MHWLLADNRISPKGTFARIWLWLLLLTIASVLVSIFKNQIGSTIRAVQGDFIIDAYYYMHLGQSIAQEYSRTNHSLLSLVEAYRPNLSSTGITYVNALYGMVVGGPYIAVAIQSALVIWATALAWPRQTIGSTLKLVVLGGLLPYMLLPSKESFVVVGYVAFLVAWFTRRSWLLSLFGVALIAVGRPEAAWLLVTALLLYELGRRIGLKLSALIFTGAYFFVRDSVAAYASFMQELTFLYGDFFCQVGPIGVCVDDGLFEVLAAKRILVSVGLPLKWVVDWLRVFGGSSAVDVIIKTSLVLQLVWIFMVRTRFTKARFREPANRFTLLFITLYSGAFVAVIFFQPSRQIALALCLLLVSLSIDWQTLGSSMPNLPDRRRMTLRSSLSSSTLHGRRHTSLDGGSL